MGMKTKIYFCAASIAALALNGVAFAAQPSTKSSATEARGGGNAPPVTATEESAMPSRTTPRMTTGRTIITEKRTFVNEHGLFETPGLPMEADQRNTIPLGRGQRIPR
jgi:hypothetical protein